MLSKKIKSFILLWLPPAITIIIKRLRKKDLSFKGNYSSWKIATQKCSGYSSENILNKVLSATLAVTNGKAIYERDSVLFDEIDYSWPVLTGLLLAAVHNNGRLNVLDFGGSLGSSYFQNRNFLMKLPELNWNVIEQPHYVVAGQEHIQEKHLKFYHTIGDCLAENQPNVILLSSVLQYLEFPEELLKQLSTIGAKYLILDRTPLSLSELDQLVIQYVPASIYVASYPMWIFSRNKLDKILSKDWKLLAHHLGKDGSFKTDEQLDFSFEGMLLEAQPQ